MWELSIGHWSLAIFRGCTPDARTELRESDSGGVAAGDAARRASLHHRRGRGRPRRRFRRDAGAGRGVRRGADD
jgi:hypothetical protein